MTPAAESANPAGGVPDANDQVFEPVPPVAASVCEYAVPWTPFGNEAVVIVRTALIVIVNDFCAVCTPSATCTVKVAGPEVEGVPLMTPAADRDNPAGGVPEANDHVCEPLPTVEVKVCEYAVPWTPFGRGDAVVIVRTALIVIVNDFCAVCTPSVTCAVKVDPAPVGVPLMTPAADNARPAGGVPEASDHVFEPVPPVAVKV